MKAVRGRFGSARHFRLLKIIPAVSSMLLFHVVCLAVLQPQCEERATNGLAPWAATTNHNPALTPPTLWQYPGKYRPLFFPHLIL